MAQYTTSIATTNKKSTSHFSSLSTRASRSPLARVRFCFFVRLIDCYDTKPIYESIVLSVHLGSRSSLARGVLLGWGIRIHIMFVVPNMKKLQVIYTCTYICVHIDMYIERDITEREIYMYIYRYMYMCMYVYIYNIYIYVYICICMYICMYVFICISVHVNESLQNK